MHLENKFRFHARCELRTDNQVMLNISCEILSSVRLYSKCLDVTYVSLVGIGGDIMHEEASSIPFRSIKDSFDCQPGQLISNNYQLCTMDDISEVKSIEIDVVIHLLLGDKKVRDKNKINISCLGGSK